ncbi:MAG: transcriptional regulator GcvA [Cohaesibacteraceae bacterium]|nr:transcriptional regulator GcvA [Cohaesibacteraceae bacterium]MBL4876332.1 transcriptional regulator GcvA [Cohaesibacteraceae bacterium]
MTIQRLPPLNALRTFEVATRHMSFRNAADELCITSTAVSHRIKALEEWLGVKLFNRLTRSLQLTKEGEVYAPIIRQAFELLSSGSNALKNSNDGGDLIISSTMSFASNWLTPRLPGFYNQHEEFAIRVEASDDPVNLARTNIDVAIRYGEGGYDGLHSQMLFTDLVAPVCTPDLAKKLSDPADLAGVTRFNYYWPGFNERDPGWQKWFTAAGLPDIELGSSPVFSEEHMVLSEAIAGRGVALVGIVAAADAIQRGALVCPFSVALENRSYYFACQPQALKLRKVTAFRNWIISEATRFDDFVEGHPQMQFDNIQRSEDLQ